jgi:hypothetical protein
MQLSFAITQLARRTIMQRCLITAMLTLLLTGSVMAEETFYVIYDKAMKGCTIVTIEPADKARYKIEGTYLSESDAEKAIVSFNDC